MSNNIKPMPIAVNDFNLKNLQEKANAKKYDNYIYDIGIFLKNNPSIANKKSNTKYWFDELKPLAPAETYISVIGKIKSNNLYKQQIEEVDKLFRDNWNNLIYLITSKDEYIKLKNDLAEYVIDDCKTKIKDLCKIDKTFKIDDKEYKITQSGIIAGMFLIKKKDDGLIKRIKDYLLKGMTFPEKGLFEKYMAQFENYYLDLLFYETFKITVPAIDENYKSDFENNPNRIAKKISLGNEKGKIVLKKFRPNFYKINIPEFLQSNGMPLGSEDTIKKDITIEDVSSDGLIVANGATLKCEGGLSTSKLTIPKSKLKLNDNYVGTVEDHIVNKNITSFKTCTYSGNANTHNNSKTAPCKIPSISEWDKGLSYFLMDKPVITDKSTCKCSYGATISIVDTGQKFWNYNGEGTAGGETQNQSSKSENSGTGTKPVGFSGGIDNSVYGGEKVSLPIKEGDVGEIVKEINIRLMGFGGGLPSNKYDKYTVKVVKQFKKDYMKQSNPDGTFVDMATIEAIDKFRDIICFSNNTSSIFYMGELKCKCKNGCSFKDSTGRQIKRFGSKKKNEHPGIHKTLFWILRAAQFYLNLENKYITKISDGYRCSLRNEETGKTSTNHMGKALDLHFGTENKRTESKTDKHRISATKQVIDIRDRIFVKKIGGHVYWTEKGIGLEPLVFRDGSKGADSWVHCDVREIGDNFLTDDYFICKEEEIINPVKLIDIINNKN